MKVMSKGSELHFPISISDSPDDLKIVVCGGSQSGHSYWFEAGIHREAPATTEIKLPAIWDELLKEAEEALGPIPNN